MEKNGHTVVNIKTHQTQSYTANYCMIKQQLNVPIYDEIQMIDCKKKANSKPFVYRNPLNEYKAYR